MADVNKILNGLSKDIETVIKQVWMSAGLKSNSDLIKSISAELGINNQLAIYALDYAEHYSKGRKKFAKKIPLQSIIEFIKKSGVSNNGMTINQLAFIIQNSIYQNGIKPKHIIDNSVAPIINIATPQLVNQIGDLIVKEINSNLKYKK